MAVHNESEPSRSFRLRMLTVAVALFDTPIIGLTGTGAQIEQIKKGYGVYSAKVPQPGGDYTIDHTAAIYLMTAKGAFSGTIDHQESDATALEKLRLIIA